MVVLISILSVVCKIMEKDSHGTARHKEWLEGGRSSVYYQSEIGVVGFAFLLSLLVLLYSKAIDDLEQDLDFLSLCCFLDTNFEFSCVTSISPTSDPAQYS